MSIGTGRCNGINVTLIKKPGPPREWYLCVWSDGCAGRLLRVLNRWRKSRDLSFNGVDFQLAEQSVRKAIRDDYTGV